MFDRETWEDIHEVEGKTIKKATADLDENGYPTVLLEFTDGVHLMIEETGQTGWIALHILGETNEPTPTEETFRWAVVNAVSFVVNGGIINAFVTEGMTGCDYDKDVPDEHWDNVEALFPGAKLDNRHKS